MFNVMQRWILITGFTLDVFTIQRKRRSLKKRDAFDETWWGTNDTHSITHESEKNILTGRTLDRKRKDKKLRGWVEGRIRKREWFTGWETERCGGRERSAPSQREKESLICQVCLIWQLKALYHCAFISQCVCVRKNISLQDILWIPPVFSVL